MNCRAGLRVGIVAVATLFVAVATRSLRIARAAQSSDGVSRCQRLAATCPVAISGECLRTSFSLPI